MMVGYRKLAAAAVAAVTAGSLSLGVVPAASAAPVAKSSARTEAFQIVSTSARSSRAPIIAYGAFAAHGVDHQGDKYDKIVTKRGTFRIYHSTGHGTTKLNPESCVIRVRQHGSYRISRGTGRFAGLTGHGTYRFWLVGIAARTSSGRCSEKKAPVAFQEVIRARGPVRR